MRQPAPFSSAEFERKAVARVTGQIFDYHRIGHDHRLMTFLPEGLVGQGARSLEIYWQLKKKKREFVLEISSNQELTCRLKEGDDGVWRGNWIAFERMPVELSPIGKLREIPVKPLRPAPSSDSTVESLFVVSLPRSLSTLVYHQARRAVGLNAPAWTSSGEILNFDRFLMFPGPTDDACRKYLLPAADPRLFQAATEFLDHAMIPNGYAYKDVVQPFVVAGWLRQNHVRTIHIRRNVADVAYSMLSRNWHYPARLFPKTRNLELALVRGLIRAELALDSISAEHIDFDQIILNEKPLNLALQKLYGRTTTGAVKFIDDNFRQVRLQILARRKTAQHKKLVCCVEEALQMTSS